MNMDHLQHSSMQSKVLFILCLLLKLLLRDVFLVLCFMFPVDKMLAVKAYLLEKHALDSSQISIGLASVLTVYVFLFFANHRIIADFSKLSNKWISLALYVCGLTVTVFSTRALLSSAEKQ